MIADGAAESGVRLFKGVKQGGNGDRRRNVEIRVVADAGELAEMGWKFDADEGHRLQGRVWTSTESTAGRSWTIACQVSPASEEQ